VTDNARAAAAVVDHFRRHVRSKVRRCPRTDSDRQNRFGPFGPFAPDIPTTPRAGEMEMRELADCIGAHFHQSSRTSALDVRDAIFIRLRHRCCQHLVAVADQQHNIRFLALELAREFDTPNRRISPSSPASNLRVQVDLTVDFEPSWRTTF